MTFWKKLALLAPWKRRAAERDIREELEALREIAGPGELGNLTLAAEDARGELTWTSVERLGQDLRYALRSMRRDKLFALLAVASLALGIGANTAIYSFLDSVVFRPLPVPHPGSLVIMKWHARTYDISSAGESWSTDGTSFDPVTGLLASNFPYPALQLFEDQHDVLATAFAYFENHQLSVTVGDRTESLLAHYVSGRYFEGMELVPAAGRLIQPSDDGSAPAAVAVVSERFAAEHFGNARAAVGRTIRVDDRPVVVVGVTPAGFFGAEPGAIPDVYLPLHASEMIRGDGAGEHFYWIELMGRLKPGITLAQAQARLAPVFFQFVRASATTEKAKQDLPQLRLQDGATGLDSLGRKYARPIYVLMTMVGLILFIACANIANLLLARGAARRREIAIRLSVGASRWRVIRQLLTESVLLSAIGGVLGLVLAWWGIRVLTTLLANGRQNFTLHAALNRPVLAVTIALSVLTGLVFGLAPAFRATRVDIAPALKDGRARDTLRPSRLNLAWGLVVAQMALSLLLLVGAGLFDRTVASLHDIPLGFNRDHVLLFTLPAYTEGYKGPAALRLFEELRERLHTIPGVRDVGLSGSALPSGGGTSALINVIGAAPSAPPHAVISSVGPDFFKTMQIPLVAGREFTPRDDASAPLVVVVNRQFADAFGLDHPVGRMLTLYGEKRPYEIVGLVENALTFFLKGDTRAAVYFPYQQGARTPGQMTYEIRTAGDPLDLAQPVRETVREADSRLAVHDMETQAEHIDQGISTEITLADLCSAFAVLALIIACVGLYGTVAFNVARRTTEIGIRCALGASAGRIMWMILRDVCLMAAAGLAIGVPAALAGSRFVKSFLYGVVPNDPAAITAAVVLLLFAGVLAGFVPARRASQIDPLDAMRCE